MSFELRQAFYLMNENNERYWLNNETSYRTLLSDIEGLGVSYKTTSITDGYGYFYNKAELNQGQIVANISFFPSRAGIEYFDAQTRYKAFCDFVFTAKELRLFCKIRTTNIPPVNPVELCSFVKITSLSKPELVGGKTLTCTINILRETPWLLPKTQTFTTTTMSIPDIGTRAIYLRFEYDGTFSGSETLKVDQSPYDSKSLKVALKPNSGTIGLKYSNIPFKSYITDSTGYSLMSYLSDSRSFMPVSANGTLRSSHTGVRVTFYGAYDYI